MAVFDNNKKPYPTYSEGTPTRRGLDRQPTVGDVAGAFGNVTGVKPYTDAAGNLINRAVSGVEQTHTANQQFIRDPTGANANANQFLRESNRGDKTPSSIPSFGPQLPTIQNPVGMSASHSADPRDVGMSARRTLGDPAYKDVNANGLSAGSGVITDPKTGEIMAAHFENGAGGGGGGSSNIFRGTPSTSSSSSSSGETPFPVRNVDEPKYITVEQAREQKIGRKAMTAINNRMASDYHAQLGERIGEMNAMKTHESSSNNQSTGATPGDPQATPLNPLQQQQFAGNQRTMDLQNIIADPSKSQEEKSRAAETLHMLTSQPDKQQIVNIPGPIDPETMKPTVFPSILNPDGKTATPITMTNQTQQPARKPLKGDTAFDKYGNELIHDGTGFMLKNPPKK